MMKRGFTTAEMLIALVVIGITAVLVAPTVVDSYHRKIYATSIKKVYSALNTAVAQACVDSDVEYFAFTKYSKNENVAEFLRNYISKKAQNGFADTSGYRTISGSTAALSLPGTSVVMEDSSALNMSCSGTECTFIVDTNGRGGPNMGGRDTFKLVLDSTTNKITGGTEGGCTASSSGEGCLQELINKDWVMEY